MPIKTRNIKAGAVSNEKLAGPSVASGFGFLDSGHFPVAAKSRYCFEDFSAPVAVSGSLSTGAAAVGTTGATNVLHTRHNVFQYFILGAGQTLVAPTLAADGLLASLDL